MRVPRRYATRIVGVLALAAGTLSCAAEDAPSGRSIEPSELASRISSGSAPVILDVRTPEEFDAGHIPGALNVPHDELEDRLAGLALSPREEIVVHCQRGGRAAAAESILREAGYSNVRDLDGHMEAWRAGGHPLE